MDQRERPHRRRDGPVRRRQRPDRFRL
jgi:hypothetical protein